MTADSERYLEEFVRSKDISKTDALNNHKIVQGIIAFYEDIPFDWDGESHEIEPTPYPHYDFHPEGARI